MKDKKRIKRMLTKLESLWGQHPEWRFGQLLVNMGLLFSVVRGGDYWRMEDVEFEHLLDIAIIKEEGKGK